MYRRLDTSFHIREVVVPTQSTSANLIDALALSNAGGNESDLLKPSDVQKLLN